MKRLRTLLLIALVAATLLVGIFVALSRAAKCTDENGIIVAFVTRHQNCYERHYDASAGTDSRSFASAFPSSRT